jgi:hypothetical protein
VVIFGFRIWTHILGSKIDECQNCGTIGQHFLVRKSYWFSLFFIPVLLLRLKHGMICGTCRAWTGIPMMQMIGGTRSGRLPLDRPRPRFANSAPDQWGRLPLAADVMDPIVHNPKPPASATYLRIWPGLAVLTITALLTYSVLFPAPKTPGGQTIDSGLQNEYGQAHDCWDDGTGISGCQLHNGVLVGSETGTKTVCYFNEPLPDSDTTLQCK